MAGRCLQVTCNTRAHRAHTQRPHLCRGACRISHTSLPKAGRSGIAAHTPKPARREQRGTGTGREAGGQAGRWGVPAGRPGKPAAIARVHSRQCLHLGEPQMAGRLQCSRATRFLCCPNQYAAWQRQWAAAVAAPSLLAVSQLPPHACRHQCAPTLRFLALGSVGPTSASSSASSPSAPGGGGMGPASGSSSATAAASLSSAILPATPGQLGQAAITCKCEGWPSGVRQKWGNDDVQQVYARSSAGAGEFSEFLCILSTLHSSEVFGPSWGPADRCGCLIHPEAAQRPSAAHTPPWATQPDRFWRTRPSWPTRLRPPSALPALLQDRRKPYAPLTLVLDGARQQGRQAHAVAAAAGVKAARRHGKVGRG